MPNIEPVNDDSLSAQIARTRTLFLTSFQTQLDSLLADKLKPQPEGSVPFIHFKEDPPQLVAIKKFINCLYHAEISTKNFSRMDTSTPWKKTKSIPPFIKGLIQLYKSMAFLEEASPEIREIIALNYNTLAPLLSKAADIIKESGWAPQFSQMNVVEKSASLINKALDVLGPDPQKWGKSNPLIEAYYKISNLISAMSKAQTAQDKQQVMMLIKDLLADLDKNKLINQLTLSDLEESQAFNDLFNWFKNIGEDHLDFTQKSLNQYRSWANNYLPLLLIKADHLERQNFLKPGCLTQQLCAAADHLGAEINKILSDPKAQINERVNSTHSLKAVREEAIKANQTQLITDIINAEQQVHDSTLFFKILRSFKGKSLEQIPEVTRIQLRQLYIELQAPLAHTNLNLENKLTKMLNQTGPKQDLPFVQKSLTRMAGCLNVDFVSDLLKTEKKIKDSIAIKIEADRFKLLLAEKARAHLIGTSEDPLDLHKAIDERIHSIQKEIQPRVLKNPQADFVPFKLSDLKTILGTLNCIQQMQLSTTIHSIRKALDSLIKNQLPQEYLNYFSPPPYVIDPKDPEMVKQIKQVEQSLFALENASVKFEAIDLSYYQACVHYETFLEIGDAAGALKQSLSNLTADAKNSLSSMLVQLSACGTGFSNLNCRISDLSELEQLKQLEPKKEIPSPVANYIKTISNVREKLLKHFQTTLTLPLAQKLNPEEKGIPFINYKTDPPQALLIKKMINSLYYAETALKIWEKIDTSTAYGKVAAAHQGIEALSQVYKSIELFSEAAPELQNLVREHYALIEPVFNGAREIIQKSGWFNQLNAMDVTKKAGSILGQGINLLQADAQRPVQSSPLLTLFTELPSVLNSIAQDKNELVSPADLRITQGKIESINSVLELLLEDNSSYINLLQVPNALIGLIQCVNLLKKEGGKLQERNIRAYQRWIEESYLKVLLMIDTLETTNFLKPGSLSKKLIEEIDTINDKINEDIERDPKSKLKLLSYSSDFKEQRAAHLNRSKENYCMQICELEEQQQNAQSFFDLLKKLDTLSPEDLLKLRQSFQSIQQTLAHIHLEITNEFTQQLVNSNPQLIQQILKLQPELENHLEQKRRGLLLKVEVANTAIDHLKVMPAPSLSAEAYVQLIKPKYLANQKPVILAELKPIASSSLNNPRGTFAFLQELKMSKTLAEIKKYFIEARTEYLSKQVQGLLTGQPKEDDPHVVKQIRAIESGFSQLIIALDHFEGIKKTDRLLNQAKALIEISNQAQLLFENFAQLAPELKQHYGPLITPCVEFVKTLKNLDTNHEDLNHLKLIVNNTKKALLKRKKPRIVEEKIPAEPPQTNLSAKELQKKGLGLAAKYAHLASPKLEKARAYLLAHYDNVFEEQSHAILSFSREQLASEEGMAGLGERLQNSLEEHYGLNFQTAKDIYNLAKQMLRVGKESDELAGMVNKLTTDEFLKIKQQAYDEIIVRLSQEEDHYCLKPGTLLNPGMAAVNQLFVSIALELEMPFKNKLALFDEASFQNIVLLKTKKDLDELLNKEQLNGPNKELTLMIAIKRDKLVFMEERMKLKQNQKHLSDLLFEDQFEVYLRKSLSNSYLKEPFKSQYEHTIRAAFADCKSDVDLKKFIHGLEQQKLSRYFAVNKIHRDLTNLCSGLSQKNEETQKYLKKLTEDLANEKFPIEKRFAVAKALPKNNTFMERISALDNGTSWFKKFKQTIKCLVKSIFENRNYYELKQEQILKNIQKSKKTDSGSLKTRLHELKDEEKSSSLKYNK